MARHNPGGHSRLQPSRRLPQYHLALQRRHPRRLAELRIDQSRVTPFSSQCRRTGGEELRCCVVPLGPRFRYLLLSSWHYSHTPRRCQSCCVSCIARVLEGPASAFRRLDGGQTLGGRIIMSMEGIPLSRFNARQARTCTILEFTWSRRCPWSGGRKWVTR